MVRGKSEEESIFGARAGNTADRPKDTYKTNKKTLGGLDFQVAVLCYTFLSESKCY